MGEEGIDEINWLAKLLIGLLQTQTIDAQPAVSPF